MTYYLAIIFAIIFIPLILFILGWSVDCFEAGLKGGSISLVIILILIMAFKSINYIIEYNDQPPKVETVKGEIDSQ